MKCTRTFRDELLKIFPGLCSHPKSPAYLAILEYLFYGTLRDEYDPNYLVFPAEVLASLVGASVGVNGFRAIDFLEGFSRDVFPLEIVPHIVCKKARRVKFQLPEDVQRFADQEALAALSSDDMVRFVSGLSITPKGIKKACSRYQESVMQSINNIDETHPAYPLQQYLNNQSQIPVAKKLRENWHRLLALHADMDDGDKKNSVAYMLIALQDWCKNLYAGSDKTVRISTRGITIHCLPRAFRKAALSGGTEFDIRSSQGAIIARLWNLPKLTAFLQTGDSFWTMMLDYLSVDTTKKQALKTALYSTCFGMGKKRLLYNLSNALTTTETNGNDSRATSLASASPELANVATANVAMDDDMIADRLSGEIGRTVAKKFFGHELMVEILKGRSEAQKRVKQDSGITDAFGRFIPLSAECPAHALLAVEAQSWELKLMLPIFETVRDVRDLSILSWLHDGVVINYSQSAEMRRMLNKRITTAFNDNAAVLKFPTDLEVAYL